jgi:hypothetical protein
MGSALLRRSILTVGMGAVIVAANTGARPFTKGVTYRVRVQTRLPAMMAGPNADAGSMILAKATALGNRARFDLQVFQPMPPTASLDDYILALDSGRVVFVSVGEKNYSDATGLLGGGGLGMLGAMAGGRGGRGGRGGGGGGGGGAGAGMPQMDMSGLVTDFEDVGPDTADGRQAHHYRVVAELTVSAMGRQVPLRLVVDTWAATLPYHIVNPFSVMAATSTDDPAAKLTAKFAEYQKKIDGTPIKTLVTTTITFDAGGGPMTLDFTQTTTITDIKEVDVDPTTLDLPAGFVKKVGG